MQYVLEAKVVVLGHTGVGKTSMLNQFVRGQFAHTTATIGAAFMRKTVQIGQWAVQLQIWDTAGQERFRSLGSMYYKGARAAVLVYDVSSPATLQKVHSWVEELQAHTATGEDEDLVMVIAANKGDLLEQKTPQELKEFVDQDEAGEYAASIDADIFITSAKSGQHVAALHLLFQNLAQKLLKQHIERGGDQAAGLSAAGPPVQRIHSSLPPLANGGEKKKGECCS